MASIRFANILLETKPRALHFPTMYYRADVPFRPSGENGAWTLTEGGAVDFTTYFNALSVIKLRRYTRATAYRLHLQVQGAPCSVTQTRATRLGMTPEVLAQTAVELPHTDRWTDVVLDLLDDEQSVLVGFQLASEGVVAMRDAYYEVDIDGDPRTVDLAIATTTFRKESFIRKNMKLVRTELLDADDDISRHLTMHVVDNGRTLDPQESGDPRITISPNENVGGAGGFARGMIEAMEQSTPATNVLLMDDDVEVSPESIRRTYELLRMVNDEYAEAFVSGAMLNIEDTEVMREDTAYIDPELGICMPAKSRMMVSQYLDVVDNEAFDEELSVPANAHRYAAWWYCCIPMSVIRRVGLPLPVFVRYDDVEYSIRSNPKFMTMNGICVWHAKFEIRYNAGVERYQRTRNGMIAQMTTGLAPDFDTFLKGLHRQVDLEMRKFNYTDAELALDGFEDFLKGPKFIEQPVAQERFMRANRIKEQMVPFDELSQQAEDMGLKDFDPERLTRPMMEMDRQRSLQERAFDYLTHNGQRFIPAGSKDEAGAESYAVITHDGWEYPAGAIHGEDIIIAVDWASRKGVIRRKDTKRYREVVKRYKRDMAYFKKHRERLAQEYKDAALKLESVGFWKRYLDME
ncbi:glycosyltransferase [Bifidobacterium pseudolongum]|uniref:Galactofuranosyltransferase n=1 Tax=Bifidobacterium pseudolongum subsp. globosum TaxID=1690 RepID=A0A4Q5A502_9BIFI|nr:glycosyltransferase [Bifidobacterium pseudolongum]RYQ16774.1 galactofuranosyltransferase [Bifidobacterium pseudolongum subsp. globosum]